MKKLIALLGLLCLVGCANRASNPEPFYEECGGDGDGDGVYDLYQMPPPSDVSTWPVKLTEHSETLDRIQRDIDFLRERNTDPTPLYFMAVRRHCFVHYAGK